jgi:glycosyltransferase involved in cell wall biosynthesis
MLGIVTISFNQAQFLTAAIDSVVTTPVRSSLKYVVVDPGSTDGSQQLVSRRSGDVNLKIFEPDNGPADGLNKGFSVCGDCEILGYLNADDRFVPGALEWVLRYFAGNPHVDVLLGAVAIIDKWGQRAPRGRVSDRFDLRRYAIGTCNAFQQGTFFRRRAFERTTGFNVDNRTCWDAELLVDMAIAGATFSSTRRLLGEFRLHSESITGSGRLNHRYIQDRERILGKIRAAGFAPYAPWQAALLRGVHRFSPVRHLSYLLAS